MLNPKGWQTYIVLIIGKPVSFTYFNFHTILKLDFYKPTHYLVKRIQRLICLTNKLKEKNPFFFIKPRTE